MVWLAATNDNTPSLVSHSRVAFLTHGDVVCGPYPYKGSRPEGHFAINDVNFVYEDPLTGWYHFDKWNRGMARKIVLASDKRLRRTKRCTGQGQVTTTR